MIFAEVVMKFIDTKTNNNQHAIIRVGHRTAYHQAGIAAAICLGNKQRKLPMVYFEIIVKPFHVGGLNPEILNYPKSKYIATLDGGRLIQNFPLPRFDETNGFTRSEQMEYQRAFEADVINILTGSLAEAKYVAARDDEIFNANLVNVNALHFYDRNSQMDVINDYLECFLPDEMVREEKLVELFQKAYSFINRKTNWHAIVALADYIRSCAKWKITCEEINAVLGSKKAA
jgi:hypothetical protein